MTVRNESAKLQGNNFCNLIKVIWWSPGAARADEPQFRQLMLVDMSGSSSTAEEKFFALI